MAVRKLMFDSFEKFRTIKIDQGIINECKRRILDMKNEEKITDLGSIKKGQYKALTADIINETNDLGNNLWAVFNGVTKFTTHSMSRKNEERNIFGNVAAGETRHKMNKEGFNFCSEYADNGKAYCYR
jgi:hypothetical protein